MAVQKLMKEKTLRTNKKRGNANGVDWLLTNKKRAY